MSARTVRSLPTIEPIVPVLGSPPLNDQKWIYEPKFDGWRGTLYLTGHSSYIRSKRGNVLRRFRELAGRVRAEVGVRDAILDGEVVALNDDGQMSFNALQAGRGWLHYVAFDLLWLNGRDMRAQPLTRRKRRLEGLIPTNNDTLSRVLAVDAHGRELFEAAQRWISRGAWRSGSGIPTPRRRSGTR